MKKRTYKKGDKVMVYGCVYSTDAFFEYLQDEMAYFRQGCPAKVIDAYDASEITVRFYSKGVSRIPKGLIATVHPKQCRRIK